MLLTPAATPPGRAGWAHDMKMDGFRCIAEVTKGRARQCVVDGELVVVADDGRANFELLAARMNRRAGDRTPGRPITPYAFDVLRLDGRATGHQPPEGYALLGAALEVQSQR